MHTHDREYCWQRRSSLPSSLIPHQYTGPRTASQREYVLPPIYGHGFSSDLQHQHEPLCDCFPVNTHNRGLTQADTPSTSPYLRCDSTPYSSNLSTIRPSSTQSPNSHCFPLRQEGKAGHPLYPDPPLTEACRKGNSYKTLDAVSDPRSNSVDSNRGEGPQSRGKSRSVIVGGNAKKLRSWKKTFIACNFCRIRKLQCDGEKPCHQCKPRANSECIYEPVRRRRGPGKARKRSCPKRVGRRPSVVVVEDELVAMPPEIRQYMTVLKAW